MCQVHTGAYVSLLEPGKTDQTACHPGKTTTQILRVVPINLRIRTSDASQLEKRIKKRKQEKYPNAASFTTASSDHHRAKMNSNGNDHRGHGVKCTRQAGSPVVGKGWMPKMPEFSSTNATSSADPAWLQTDEIAPNPCSHLGRRFALPCNKRVELGVPHERWGGGNAWQMLRFSFTADAMGSGVGSTHGNILPGKLFEKYKQQTTAAAGAVDYPSYE